MKIIGLTGSIATGKSFVAEIFRKNNIKVFSSDYHTAKLLEEAHSIDLISKVNGLSLTIKDGSIDKRLLSSIVFKDALLLEILENILHPAIEQKREEFILENKQEKFILFEVPLLFEKNYQKLCAKVITTYCGEKTQRERALRRENIDSDRLDFIVNKQMQSSMKAKLTDYMVYTDISYEYTHKQITEILKKEAII